MTSDKADSEAGPKLLSRLRKQIKSLITGKEKKLYSSIDYEKLDITRQNMIRGVFKLSELNARDIMIPRVDIIALDSTITLKSLVKAVTDAGHSRVPVFEETIDHISGILYSKDLIKLLFDKPKNFQLKKILHEPYFVPETMPLDELLYEFKKRKLHLAIVVDEYGGVAGIVTMEDVLEEIVGEIRDEFDTDELPELQKTGKNSYEVDSRMPISDLNEKLGLKLSTGEFDTIGGLIFDLFGKIPEKDETVKFENLTFKIKDINGTIINRIIITISSD